jgi:eukaryotic-like serine/threonine-protein kinase
MKFGQYELRELIAVGGMAEVYKGRVAGAEGFEKLVAIKRILPDLAEDERFVKMLLTEARIHSALSHRNIVQIHDLGISGDGEYFIVLEYVEGYDLRVVTDQLSEQGEIIPEALSLHIAAEIAQGLHFAHELRGADGQPLGLVHRDVTPSNVLLSLSGEVKLSDFGIAKRRQDHSVVGSLKGNLAYMSPEQARQSNLDRRTDVFSLGAMLFEMLTGKRLREITDEIAGWNHVASGQVPSVRAVRPDLPESFERLIATALAPELERRYADAATFATAIRGVLKEMNTPVGASDLQALLATLHPPRRPRSLVSEVSKVIRLGPEARALGEAIAGPTTPGARTPPGMTPLAPPRGGVTGMPATPPPTTPLPPVQPWRANPNGPVPLPRADRRTPPGPFPISGAPPANLHSAASTAELRKSGSWPAASAVGGGVAVAPAPAFVPEMHATTEKHLRPVPLPRARPRRETVRVLLRGGPSLWPVAIAIGAALVLIAGAVHVVIVPLDVLAVWREPATLTITSEPPGALVRLDGVALDVATPAQVSVRRDRYDHVLQLSAPGYRAARQGLRYDRATVLAQAVRLEREGGPVFQALPPAVVAVPAAVPPKAPKEAPARAAPTAKATPAAKAAKVVRRPTKQSTKTSAKASPKTSSAKRARSKH